MVSAISARGTVTTASWMSCSRRRSAPMADPACSVPTPPGWPVPQAFRRSSASAPRTSPIGIRSGRSRKRRADEVRERGRAILGAQRHEVGRGALQLAGVLDQDDAVAGLGDFGEERIDQGRLAGRSAAGDQDVLPLSDGGAQELGLQAGHDAGLDIVAEGEDGDGRTADGEARRRHHGRDEPLETLPALGQFGGDTRSCRHELRRRHGGRRAARCVRRRRARRGGACPRGRPTAGRSKAGRRD